MCIKVRYDLSHCARHSWENGRANISSSKLSCRKRVSRLSFCAWPELLWYALSLSREESITLFHVTALYKCMHQVRTKFIKHKEDSPKYLRRLKNTLSSSIKVCTMGGGSQDKRVCRNKTHWKKRYNLS